MPQKNSLRNMKLPFLILVFCIVSHFAIAQLVITGDSETGEGIVNPNQLENWMAKQMIDYQGVYHFGFSEGESEFLLFITEDTCYAQVRWTDFTKDGKDLLYTFINFKNVHILNNNFLSSETNGDFAIYNKDSGKTQGLIVHKPWPWSDKVKPHEFGFKLKISLNNYFSGNYPQASYKLLNENDLRQFSLWDLKIMRNEIYARYHFIFKTGGEMDQYFRTQGWYSAKYKNVDGFLTGLEKRNIKLIQRIEQNNNGL